MVGLQEVDFSGDIHKVWINERSCIVKRLLSQQPSLIFGLPSEQHYSTDGRRVSALQFVMVFLNQEVVIVGAGDSACEEAHYLSKLCKSNHVGLEVREF
jgi:thioredoxin reductase (NADPH)